jgi:hypothetical protein
VRRRTPAVLALALSVALATSLEASAGYQQGLDPNDIDGPGDIRLVSVRRYVREETRYVRVIVRLHADSDFTTNGRVLWKLDGRGGPRIDHRVSLVFDLDGGLLECTLYRIGHGQRAADVVSPGDGAGCRFPVSDSRLTRMPRFRAGIRTVHDVTLAVGHDRAPNKVGRFFP